MTDSIEGPAYIAPAKPTRKLSARTGIIAAALLAAGVGGGATIAHMTGPNIEMAPLSRIAIKALSDSDSIITVRGKVAEVYGPTFILTDGSGRALVEAGRHPGFLGGGATSLVAVGQTVTVQGHFRDGTIHASFLVGADGKVTALHPMGPPRGGPGGPGGPDGFRHGGPRGPEGRGPDGGPDAANAPPPPAAAPAAAPAATGNSAG